MPAEFEKRHLDDKAIVVIAIICLVVVAKVVGTIIEMSAMGCCEDMTPEEEDEAEFEMLTREKKPWARVLYCFSLARNWRSIFKDKDDHLGDIRFMHGLLFFGIITFIMHTCYTQATEYGTNNTEFVLSFSN
jgi:hypothetical protein